MVRQGSSETTARIELKRRMADGGCQNWVEAAVVNISAVILHPPSLKMFSTAAALRHPPTAVVVAVVSSSRCGAIPTVTVKRTMTTTRAVMTAPTKIAQLECGRSVGGR
jgi:hypothetical protein